MHLHPPQAGAGWVQMQMARSMPYSIATEAAAEMMVVPPITHMSLCCCCYSRLLLLLLNLISSGGYPCTQNWQGVICSRNNVTELYVISS
jgi:hypothetical protein